MKILVTGSDGFTGLHFNPSAQAAGHELVALKSDLRQAGEVADEVAGLDFDAVVHLAAISFVAHSDARALYDVNLFGALHLLDALIARGRPLRRALFCSSANVYGNCEASPIGEMQPAAPVNHYAMSKLAMELMLKARTCDFPLVVTRPFNYTGRHQAPEFVIPKLVDHFRRRAPVVALGNLNVEREYNDVRLVCEAYVRLLESAEAEGTYNVCTGVAYSLGAVIDKLQNLTGHRMDVRVDPAFMRANEVHRLCGDPSRLVGTIGGLPTYQLEDTLSWMLQSPA